MKSKIVSEHSICESFIFKQLMETAERVASHPVPVLIEGEPGTGKEWLASAIHFMSSHSGGPFIIVDCRGMSEVMLEKQLFGYVSGSFAGAVHDKTGLLEAAHKGTLFLDHISDLPLTVQSKLIHFLKHGSFYKIGSVSEKSALDVRVIAATELDLRRLVRERKMREELFYLFNVIKITVPPLRERREDIGPLANFFLKEAAESSGNPKKTLSGEALKLLMKYDWPGNLRELRCELEHCVVLSGKAATIMPRFLSARIKKKSKSGNSRTVHSSASFSLKHQKKRIIEELERDSISEALQRVGGNRTKAAALLEISRQELLRKIAAYRIKSKRHKNVT